MSRLRGFEVALTTERMVNEGKATEAGVEQFSGVILPKRETERAAGYDFRAAEDTLIPSIWKGAFKQLNSILRGGYDDKLAFMPTLIHTGVKSYMSYDEVLEAFVRSSTPRKFGLVLANSTGIIDADYYSNEDNDGEIMFMVYNIFPFDVTIKKGERFGQGIFKKFYTADNDGASGKRKGGVGSSDEK